MWKYTVKIDGMMCGMCEAHMNDAIRKEFDVKKVTSSHTKNESVIICENELDEAAISKAVADTGYELKGIEKEPYKKRGLFRW